VPAPGTCTRTGIANPGTTSVHRYESVPLSTRYSNTGMRVVVRYYSNTLLRSMPAWRLMYSCTCRPDTV
jgi:hypothetical protein